MASDRRAFILKTLGPGLLFAGAAVGVSHLVQSTRAGSVYGFGLLLVIVVANVLKYPAFSFGPRYAAATGTSLLEGYRRQGLWALVTYALLTVGTMFTVLAAVTVVTAGLAKNLFALDSDVARISGLVMIGCALFMVVGKYHWLDRAMKLIMAALTVSTVIATLLVLPKIDWAAARLWPGAGQWNIETALFVAALAGWMPSAIDISVWHSLWTLAKRKDADHAPTIDESMLDFDIGYWGSAFLAVCFMLLGAGVLYGTGVKLSPTAGGFASQVIGLYTSTLGDWSRYLIGSCAFAVMLSTTMTVVDGFPRALTALVDRFRRPEEPGLAVQDSGPVYWMATAILIAGAYLIIDKLVINAASHRDFTLLIDVATVLSFLTAPVLAALNHRSVFAADIDADKQPSPRMRLFSVACIALLSAFALAYLYIRFLR
jgi:Mn2+/Fe2+ NRAMP family transporter